MAVSRQKYPIPNYKIERGDTTPGKVEYRKITEEESKRLELIGPYRDSNGKELKPPVRGKVRSKF